MFGIRSLRNAGIATKLCGALGLLAVAAGMTGGSGLYAVHVYNNKVGRMERASERAITGEKVNGLINAIVMDSRGLYLTNDATEIEAFAKPLLANLVRINDLMTQWSRLLDPEQQGALAESERQVRDFFALRTELVRVSRSSGATQTNLLGNNKTNRANRQALNAAVTTLAQRNAADVATVARDLDQFQQTMSILLPTVTLGVISASVVLVLFLVIGGITRPLARIVKAMKRLAGGEFDIVVPDCAKHDEIGQMAGALEVFRVQAVENRRLTEARELEREEAEVQKRNALLSMAANIEATASMALTEVGQRSDELATTADGMRSMVERTGRSAQAAAAAAGQASANAQTVSGAAEELAASIRSISGQVSSSAAIVMRAVAAGDETRAAIDALNQEVGRIGAVAGMIGKVAQTTNLLALNATIEAARAGEAGKGFTVVASEVKQLAAQTAQSTQEIARLIGAVQAATGAALDAVNHMKATVSEIDAVSSAITEAVAHQGAATAEIARNVAETAAAVAEMNERNVEVCTEAGRGAEYVDSVMASTKGLSLATRELKAAITRTVRTSSQEVNRRLLPRHQVDWAAEVHIKGQSARPVRVLDVSSDGMRFTGCPGLAIGQQGLLRLDGLQMQIQFTVASYFGDQTGVSLEDDPALADAISAMLEARPKRNAA
jgi:methyl-accepting chemotaxis protein